MAYVKSYSNYVLKKKHQNVDDGTIYERDITTIGGRDNFSPGQVPLYNSGSFVITVNNDDNVQKDGETSDWEKNNQGEVWTLQTLKDYVTDDNASDDTKIVLKRDYYDLRDFAYFGSCSELIRASVSDIIKKFPGELYVPYDNSMAYTYEYKIDEDSGISTTMDIDEINENPNYSLISSSTVGGVQSFYIDNTEFNGGSEEATGYDSNDDSKKRIKRLGGDTKFLVDNPFNIDIHTTYLKDSTEDSLKYFADNGYKNYELINQFDGSSSAFTWSSITVSADCTSIGNKISDVKISPISGTSKDESGNTIYEIDSGSSFTIEAYLSNNKKIVYLIDLYKYHNLLRDGKFQYSIRPKTEFMDEFQKNLDSFESILMNPDSSPKYTAVFNVMHENEYGYYTQLESFTFPTTYGDYNIGSEGSSFEGYLTNLSDIASFYDERFSDNLYRSLTHEAIKNFDWTYYKHQTDDINDDEEDLKESANKVEKVLRVFGREFDEILAYIDNISNYNAITYNGINNLSDYFLTDALENDGWDIKQIIPLTLYEYTVEKINSVNIAGKPTEDDEKSNTYQGNILHRLFTQDTSFNVKPYSSKWDIYANGYFFGCSPNFKPSSPDYTFKINDETCENEESGITLSIDTSGGTNTINVKSYVEQTVNENSKKHCGYDKFSSLGEPTFTIDPAEDTVESGQTTTTTHITSVEGETISGDTFIDCAGILRNRIKNYSSETEWSMTKVNNEFMKRLILNSRWIWRHKGTQEGIEMILGMFGMKSKQWFDSLPEYEKDTYAHTYQGLDNYKPYDYEIKEYTSFAKRIEDKYFDSLDDYEFDWVNKQKEIGYDNDEYEPYEGLMTTYRTVDSGATRYLYPEFQKDSVYDGNPYYQMNGGWLSTAPYMFDAKDNLLAKKDNSESIYQETIRNIRSVSTLADLFTIPVQDLTNGDIVSVKNIKGEYAVVDGQVYELKEETDGVNTYRYFTVQPNYSSLSIGLAFFDDYVVVSDPYAPDNKRRYGIADNESDGIEIKVYLIHRENVEGETIYAYSDTDTVSTFTVFENGKYMAGSGFTNYFRINDVAFSNELSTNGWQQLHDVDYDYYKINSQKDYYFGNNPHTGHFHYDNGHEYFTYLRRLFRYSYDESLLNDAALSRYPNFDVTDLYGRIEDYGFKGLINDDTCQNDYEDFLTEDSKAHYFGDWWNGISSYTYSIDAENLETPSGTTSGEALYNLSLINPLNSKVEVSESGYGWMTKGCYSNSVEGSVPVDGVRNQIVNNKVVKVIFYIRDTSAYTKTALEEIKYLQSVVVPYMTQLMPSGAILGTEYRYTGQNVHSFTIKTTTNGEPMDGITVKIYNPYTDKWETVGYTEQGLITFRKDGDMDRYKVKIDSANTESSSLELDKYYIANEYAANPNISVEVSTNYTKTIFEDTEGEIDADGCLEFSGKTEINNISSDEYFKISKDGTNWANQYTDDWLSAETEDVTASGGNISISIEENTMESDREKVVFVKFKDKQKKIIVNQYTDNTYVTYTVISNADSNAQITFTDGDNTITQNFDDGYAEYARRRIGSKTISATITDGLPSSSITYSIVQKDGQDSQTVSNTKGSVLVDLIGTKTSTNYSWDEKTYTTATTFDIKPDETVTKNYYVWRDSNSFSGEGYFTVEVLKNNGWLRPSKTPSKTPSHKLDYDNNARLSDRSASVIFRISENPSTSLNYRIIQTNANYTFEFDKDAIAKNGDNKYSLSNDERTLTYETNDFEAWALSVPRIFVKSLMNDTDFADYTPMKVVNDKDVVVGQISARLNGGSILISLNKNVNLTPLTNIVKLTQQGSGKTLYIKVIQGKVVCKIGDVYCYTEKNGVQQHSFIDLNEYTIPQGTTPVGIVAMPMKNSAETNSDFARIVSLVEQQTNQNTNIKYGWRQDYDKKTKNGDVLEVNHENRLYQKNGSFDWYDGMSGSQTKGTYHNRYDRETSLYYYNDDRHLPRILDSNGCVTSAAKKYYGNDDNESAIKDFDGFGRTYRKRNDMYKANSGAILNMIYKLHKINNDSECWFIGSIGEMAAIFQNIDCINNSIRQLNALYNNNFKLIVDTTGHAEVHGAFNHYYSNNGDNANYYWTSTYYKPVKNWDEQNHSDKRATWAINMASGNIRYAVYSTYGGSNHQHWTPLNVRPMLLVNETGEHKPKN